MFNQPSLVYIVDQDGNERKIAAKDIRTADFLRAIETVNDRHRKEKGDQRDHMVTRWDLEEFFPLFPAKVIMAKIRKLEKQGYIEGCGCGCRGDIFIADLRGDDELEEWLKKKLADLFAKEVDKEFKQQVVWGNGWQGNILSEDPTAQPKPFEPGVIHREAVWDFPAESASWFKFEDLQKMIEEDDNDTVPSDVMYFEDAPPMYTHHMVEYEPKIKNIWQSLKSILKEI